MYQMFHPSWCVPPHRLTHQEKYEELVQDFIKNKGWSSGYPVLIGYWFENKIQLISGTHRYYAAITADILLPIEILQFEYVYSIWGTDTWIEMIKNPKVYL